VVKEGQIAYIGSRWECDHCKIKVRNKDSSRLTFQLSGDLGLRGAGSGFTGVEVCFQVPQNAAGRAKIEMVAKTAKKAHKSSLGAAGQVMASEEGDLRTQMIQDTLQHLSNKDA
jgi:hypothetical protein